MMPAQPGLGTRMVFTPPTTYEASAVESNVMGVVWHALPHWLTLVNVPKPTWKAACKPF